MHPRVTVTVLLWLALCCTAVNAQEFVYVTNSFTNNISTFNLNGDTGALALLPPFTSSGGLHPSSIVVAPSWSQAFVANRDSNNVVCFAIDPNTGALNQGSVVQTGLQPGALAVDPSQGFLYAANAASNSINGFKIASSCNLTPVPGSPFPITGSGPIAMAFDNQSNLFVTNSLSNNITRFTMDATTGVITLAGPPVVTGANPSAIVVDPLPGIVLTYVANTVGNSVYGFYDITGNLQAFGTFLAGPQPSSLEIANNNLFVANSGSGSISDYAIDPLSGALNQVPGSPFPTGGTNPVAIKRNRLENWLAGVDFNNNQAFTVGIGLNGVLNPIPGSPVQTGGLDPTSLDVFLSGFLPPVLSKQFGATSIAPGAVTTLTFTITNPNATIQLAGIAFHDVLAPLTIASPNGLTTTCDGFPGIAAGYFSLAGASLPPGGSCTISLNVTTTASATGSILNTTSRVASSAPAFGNSASDSITVQALSTPHLVVTTPSTATAGQPLNFTVSALDSSNNPVSNFGGVHFSSSDATATFVPPGLTIGGGGIVSGTVTLTTPGTQTITAISNATPSITATSNPIIVVPQPTNSIILGPMQTLIPGQQAPFPVSLSTAAGGDGVIVNLTSSDPSKVGLTPLNTPSATVFVPAGAFVPNRIPAVIGVNYGSSVITATAPGFTSAAQTVQVAGILTFSPANVTLIGFPSQKSLTLSLNSPAPPGGVTINIGVDDPTVLLAPSGVTIPAGMTQAQVPIMAASLGSTLIRASDLPNILVSTASVTVVPGLAPLTATLPDGTIYVPYSAALTATGGTAPYSFLLSSGTLPVGLQLNGATGLISGTPTAPVIKSPLLFDVTDSSVPARKTQINVTLTIKQQ